MHRWDASSKVLQEAVESGIITQDFGEWYTNTLISNDYVSWVESQYRGNITADLESLALSPRSIHYREHTFGRMVHPSDSAPFSYWSVEVARFCVPLGNIGVIKGFEQYLSSQALLQIDSETYTISSRWGIPGPWLPGDPILDSGRWHFRLSQIGGRSPIQWNSANNIPLPGLPYTDLPWVNDLSFPFGTPASQNIHLLIPGNNYLRLYYITPIQPVRLEVAAKLKGYIQSAKSLESGWNARTNW
jgi:hypothetical protein